MEVPEWARSGASPGKRLPQGPALGRSEVSPPRAGVVSQSSSFGERRHDRKDPERKARDDRERSVRHHERDYRGRKHHRRREGASSHERKPERHVPVDNTEKKFQGGHAPVKSKAAENVPVVLSKTEGLAAVSAWKAREELVTLLEKRADPLEVAAAIRAGVEGTPYQPVTDKSLLGSEKPRSSKVGPSAKSQSPRSRSSRGDQRDDLAGMFGTSVEEQRFLLLGGGVKPSLPEWTGGSPSAAIRFEKRAALPPKQEDAEVVVKFAAKASLPPAESLQPPNPPSEDSLESEESGWEEIDQHVEEEQAIPFEKKARLPHPDELEIAEPPPPPPPKIRGGGRSKPELEQLEKYNGRARAVFERLVVAKVKMDLVDLVFDASHGPPLDGERFALHTEPKSASTGLRYVRLIERLLDFYDETTSPESELNPVSGAVVTAFIESLIENEAGYRTPQAVMYALDFFGVVFGFHRKGAGWDRCLKVSGTYASKRPPRTGADFLTPEMLMYLEKVVNDGSRGPADRLVAGRLRLCCQASVRHSDLVRTRLRDVEWCRDKGKTTVRGLRAC